MSCLIVTSFACSCLRWVTCIWQCAEFFEFLENISVLMWRLLRDPPDDNFLVFQGLIFVMLIWDCTDLHALIREGFFQISMVVSEGNGVLLPAFDWVWGRKNKSDIERNIHVPIPSFFRSLVTYWSANSHYIITEWLRLEGTSGGHLIQPLCSSRVA